MTANPDPDALRTAARRLNRERAARREAEAIAERVTGDLYETTRDLQRANDELEMLNHALREFVAIASHDLRGPLTGILGMTALLNRRWSDIDNARRTECLLSIERQGQVLARLVDDLLTVSKLEAHAVECAAEVVALRDAIRTAVSDTVTISHDVTIDVDVDDVRVVVDPHHLRRIITNYVGNALTYGAPPLRVEARTNGTWAEVLVRDCGQGVPEDLLPRLFGTFVRGEGSRERGGTGLGLSIVRGLARVNGGDAWYEPNSPNGSCFGVRLRASA